MFAHRAASTGRGNDVNQAIFVLADGVEKAGFDTGGVGAMLAHAHQIQ